MWSRAARLTVSILLPAVFLGLFFWQTDLGKLRVALAGVGAGWWLLILAALIQVVHLLIRAARWRILLGPLKKDVGYYNLVSTISIGYLVTMLLPGRVGEVIRPVLLAGRENISKGGALATVLLERLMDALTVASLLAIYLLFFLGGDGDQGLAAAAGLSFGWGVAFGALIVLSFPMLWAVVHFRHRVAAVIGRVLPDRTPAGRIAHKIFHNIVDGFEILKGGRTLVAAWAWSFTIWLIIAFSIWFSVKAFGINISLPGSLLMTAALTFGIAIPTPGGVGGYEFLGQQALVRFFGEDPSRAAAAVLVMHVFAISPSILMGFVFLWREGLSFSRVASGARAAAIEEAGPEVEGLVQSAGRSAARAGGGMPDQAEAPAARPAAVPTHGAKAKR